MTHFFLCIFWSLGVLKKSCSLTSQWCHKNNNLLNPKNTIQFVKVICTRWKLSINLSFLIVSVTVMLSLYSITITATFSIGKRSPNRPFFYIINTYICNTIWYFCNLVSRKIMHFGYLNPTSLSKYILQF